MSEWYGSCMVIAPLFTDNMQHNSHRTASKGMPTPAMSNSSSGTSVPCGTCCIIACRLAAFSDSLGMLFVALSCALMASIKHSTSLPGGTDRLSSSRGALLQISGL